MYKYLFICFFITLQSCSSVKKVKVPNKYPVGVHFSSVCCGTASQGPICNFISNFLQQYNLCKIYVIYSPCLYCDEGEYSLYFPLNGISKKQENDFIIGITNIVKNIKPETESEGTITLTELNKKFKRNIWKKKYGILDWAYYSYDSTMNCSNWMKAKPLAGSPKYLKLLDR